MSKETRERFELAGGCLALVVIVGGLGWAGWYFLIRSTPKPPQPIAGSVIHGPITAAVQMRQMMEARNAEVVQRANQVLATMKQFGADGRPDQIDKVRALRESCGQAIAAVRAMEEGTLSLDRDLRLMQTAHEAAAAGFRKRAEDYTDVAMREVCLGMAQEHEKTVNLIPGVRIRLDAFKSELPGTLHTVRQSAMLLDDYLVFVNTYGEAVPVPETLFERYARMVKEYAARFELFERAVNLYRAEMQKITR